MLRILSANLYLFCLAITVTSKVHDVLLILLIGWVLERLAPDNPSQTTRMQDVLIIAHVQRHSPSLKYRMGYQT